MYEYRGGEGVDAWVQQRSGLINSQLESIGQFKDGELEAAVTYYNYNGNVIYASIAIEQQITKTFVREIFRYPFEVLNVNKIVATVNSLNTESQEFVKKLGFELVAIVPEIAVFGGDLMYFIINKDEASKWLGKDE